MASLTKALPAHPQPESEPSSASLRRWGELAGSIAGLVPAGPASVLIDGGGAQMGIVAGSVAAALNAGGRPCFRLPDTGHPRIPTSAVVLAEGRPADAPAPPTPRSSWPTRATCPSRMRRPTRSSRRD